MITKNKIKVTPIETICYDYKGDPLTSKQATAILQEAFNKILKYVEKSTDYKSNQPVKNLDLFTKLVLKYPENLFLRKSYFFYHQIRIETTCFIYASINKIKSMYKKYEYRYFSKYKIIF